MTNAEKIISLLSRQPGLDDDEISHKANIHPRQTVNQICRTLDAKGLIRRVREKYGKIVNYLTGTDSSQVAVPPRDSNLTYSIINKTKKIKTGHPSVPRQHAPTDSRAIEEINSLVLSDTLILVPCSGRKTSLPGSRMKNQSISDYLPEALKFRLYCAREALAATAGLDESQLVPAMQRYIGSFYQAASEGMDRASKLGVSILIISGGYGLILANEPIGNYDQEFKLSNWPKGLLEEVLLTYVTAKKIKNVVAFLSASTGYRKFLDKVQWIKSPVRNVYLITAESSTGAMVKAPRALGEALSSYLANKLTVSFESSDGLRLEAQRLTPN